MARCTAPKLIAAKIVTKGARIAPVKMLLATGMIVVGGLACASSKLMKNDKKDARIVDNNVSRPLPVSRKSSFKKVDFYRAVSLSLEEGGQRVSESMNHHSSEQTEHRGRSMDRKPYLDKICDNPHMPHVEGYKNLNSSTTFPDLKHTGIKSMFEPETVTTATPEGRITADFKQQSYLTMRDIFRDDVELKSRELVFKRSHKQFMDQILLDMDEKKSQSLDRRAKHWAATKSNLGFNDQFNSHLHGGGSVASENRLETLHTTQSTKKERTQRAVNRIILFKNLLETVEPPPSPTKHFGTISTRK